MNDELTLFECYDILKKYGAPKIVIKHCESVAKVSYLIAKKLIDNGINIDLKKLIYASLLHDLFKIIEIDDYTKHNSKKEIENNFEIWEELKKRHPNKNHIGAFTLEFKKRYPKITNIVNKHGYTQVNKGFSCWEEKILNYADKLVDFDKITTLKQRLDNVHKRYAKKYSLLHADKGLVESTDKNIFGLEKEIFKKTGLSSDDLIELNNIKFRDLIKKDFSEDYKYGKK